MTLTHLNPFQFFSLDAIATDAPVLVQIGDLTGETAGAFLSLYPAGRAVIVEADPANYAALVAANKAPGIETVHAALAERDGPIAIHRYCKPTASSIFPLHDITGEPLRGSASVDGYTLRALLALCHVDRVDLLLMNCEGAELYALREIAADAGLSARIGQMCVAMHDRAHHIYPKRDADSALQALEPSHDAIWGKTSLPYVLLIRR